MLLLVTAANIVTDVAGGGWCGGGLDIIGGDNISGSGILRHDSGGGSFSCCMCVVLLVGEGQRQNSSLMSRTDTHAHRHHHKVLLTIVEIQPASRCRHLDSLEPL